MGAETSREEEIQRAKKIAETTGKMEKKMGGGATRDIAIMDEWMKAKFKHGVNYNMKVVIRGASGSGKTQLFRLLQGKPYDPLHEPTPSISSANIHWAYKDSPEVIKVEVWDVVDKGMLPGVVPCIHYTPTGFSQSTRAEMLKIRAQNFLTGRGKHSPLSAEEMIADASTVNVYRGCNAVVLLFDITRRDTWEYVMKEMKAIPKTCHVVILANFYDLHEFRQVSKAEIVSAVRQFQKGVTLPPLAKSTQNPRWCPSHPMVAWEFAGAWEFVNGGQCTTVNRTENTGKVQALEETVRSLYDEIDREDDNFSILAETQDYSAYHARKQQGVLASVKYPKQQLQQSEAGDSEPNSPTSQQLDTDGQPDRVGSGDGEEYERIEDGRMEVDGSHPGDDNEPQPRKKHKPTKHHRQAGTAESSSVQSTAFTPAGNKKEVDDWLGSASSDDEQNAWFPDEESDDDKLGKQRRLGDRFRDKYDEESGDDGRPVPTQHDVAADPPSHSQPRPKKAPPKKGKSATPTTTTTTPPTDQPATPPLDPSLGPATLPESFNSSFGVGFRKARTPSPKLSQTELNERKLQEEIRATMEGSSGNTELKDFFADQSESDEGEPEPPVFEEEADLPPRPAMFLDVVDSPDNALEGKIVPRNRQISTASSEHMSMSMSMEFDKDGSERPETPTLQPRPETPPGTTEKPKKVEQTAEMQAVLQAALQNALQAEEEAEQERQRQLQQLQQLQQQRKEQQEEGGGGGGGGGGAPKRRAKKKAGKPKPKGKPGNRPSSRSTTTLHHQPHSSDPPLDASGSGAGFGLSGSVQSIRSHSGSVSGSVTTDTESRPVSRLSALPPRNTGGGNSPHSSTNSPTSSPLSQQPTASTTRKPKKTPVLKKKKMTLKKKKQSSQQQVPDNEIVMMDDKEEEELQFTIPPCSGQEPLDDDDEELTFGK